MAGAIQGLLMSYGRPSSYVAEYMVVAGGGGRSGGYYQPGGGAGGSLSGIFDLKAGVTYNLQVGAGGSGSSNGTDSYISASSVGLSILSYGGGGSDQNGGSGGGGLTVPAETTLDPGGTGVAGQGTNGQLGTTYAHPRCPSDANYFRCSPDSDPARGGAKNETSTITGTAIVYAPSSSSGNGLSNTGQRAYAGRTSGSALNGGSGVAVIAIPDPGVTLEVSAGLSYQTITARSGYVVYRFTGGLGTFQL